MRYRDLTAKSSRYKGILVILDFFSGYFGRFRALRLFWSIKRFQRIFFFGDILWFWENFGDFWSIMAILGISRVFFM